jgi:serine/threonine-protein kinase haspin
MPKKQAVYGKRSLATSTSTNIFASPENTRRKAVETIQILTDDEIAKRKQQSAHAQSVESALRPRKALGEINGNAVLNVEVPTRKDTKKSKKSKTTKKRSKDEGTEQEVHVKSSDVVEEVVRDVVGAACEGTSTLDLAMAEKALKEVAVPIEEQIQAQIEVREETTQETQEPIIEPATYDGPDMALQPSAQSDCYTEHCASLLELTAYPVSSFSEWANDLNEDFSLVKIAEASFGEVYRLSLQPEAAEDTDLALSRNDESVLKVIALTQPTETLPKSKRDRERALKKAENMSKPNDVASELKLLQRLSDIPGFTNFRDLRVLRGRPPAPFATAFTAFNEAQKAAKKELSIFPDPAKKASYSKDQLWAVIEMQDAGTDLEKLVAQGISSNIWVVWDIFWQVVLALAKGEEEAEFEHRDLHLGNICVRTPEAVDEAKIDISKSLGFTSFEATLIDYTVSRASMIPASMVSESTETKDDSVAYIDLANDPHLFYGDSAEEYQYDIYRYMRGSIYYSSPYASFPNDGTSTANHESEAPEGEDGGEDENESEEPQLPTAPSAEEMATIERETGRSWRQFQPQTNLCWLHYVLFMLLEQMHWPSSVKAPSKKSKPEAHARWKRARELENALLQVQESLDPGWLGEEGSLARSGEIIAWAVEEGWLRVEDVVGDNGEFEEFGEEVQDAEDDDLARQLDGLALQPAEEEVNVSVQAVVKVEMKSKKTNKKAKKGE